MVTTQVFPAWAVLALLLRLEPRLRQAGVYPDLGWFGLASSVLAAIAGMLSAHWKQSLGAWLSAGFCRDGGGARVRGPFAGVLSDDGVGLGASALAGFASALEQGGTASGTARKRALWAKTGCALGAAAGTGFLGFVSCAGGARAISLVWGVLVLAAALAAVFFFFALVGWKVAWQAIATKNNTQAPWLVVLMPYALVVLALGLCWTGTLSGGAVPGDPDRVFPGLSALLFGSSAATWGDDATIAASCGVYWAALLCAAGLAAWTTGRRPEFWPGVQRGIPRLSAFVLSGYGVDAAMTRLRAGLAWVGAASGRCLDRGVWEAWVPALLGRGLRRGAAAFAAADLKLSRGLGTLARGSVDLPSRALQLIQNGDVQWYLFFAVGSGIAILAHYLTTRG